MKIELELTKKQVDVLIHLFLALGSLPLDDINIDEILKKLEKARAKAFGTTL